MKAQLPVADTQYSTLLYNNRHLIVKWTADKEPFVIAEVYTPEFADTICELLQGREEQEKSK